MSSTAIAVSRVSHRYGERIALDQVDLTVASGEIFAIVGPNGGGKTTLFRLLSTLIPLQTGEIAILGGDVRRDVAAVRSRLGVVFQAPSLDRKLTVRENLVHQGHLYGLSGGQLSRRVGEMLARVGLTDRGGDLVETLSGGLRRRVELAKGLLHGPQVLLLDEPSTGLDPGARGDLWRYLAQLRSEQRVTVLLTTHLLEEADRADRLAIIDRGRIVAVDTPASLRATLGGDTITIEGDDPERLAGDLNSTFGVGAKVLDGQIRFEQAAGHQAIARLVEAFPGRIRSISLGKPTLEDVFIARTGHKFWSDESAAAESGARATVAEARA